MFNDDLLRLRPGDYVNSKRNIRIRKLLKVLPTKPLKRDHDIWALDSAFQMPYYSTDVLSPAHEYPGLSFPDFDPAKDQICMRTFCLRFNSKYQDPRPGPLRWASTLLSHLVVTDILRSSYYEVEDRYREWIINHAVTEHREPQRIVLERLFSCGWCPWEIHMLSERSNAITCFYISQMQRPNPATRHVMLRPALSNGTFIPRQARTWECGPNMCQLKKIDQNSYSTAHSDPCTVCNSVAIDRERMSGILLSGRIPLILVHQLTSKTDAIELAPHIDEHETVLPYVAFSHVWSDGLGNLNGNSLPRCQFERLKLLVEAYNSRKDPGEQMSHFWIDTLCVPPDSTAAANAAATNLQQLATHKMKETYEQAAVVIVLDQWLVDTSSNHVKASEIVMRIVCSPWTRRLWTLQEGLLARWHGLFVVLDRVRLYNVDDIWERLKHVDTHWP